MTFAHYCEGFYLTGMGIYLLAFLKSKKMKTMLSVLQNKHPFEVLVLATVIATILWPIYIIEILIGQNND